MDAAFLLQLSAPAAPAGVSAAAVNPGQGHVNEGQAAAAAARVEAFSRTQERQQQSNRLVTAYRDEAKLLMKELLKQQIAWREELAASGVHVGIPTMQPPKGITIRKRLSWRTAEREALKRLLFAHGVGKWKEIHNCLCAQIPGFRHGVADAEDACWQLLGELQLLVSSHEEHAYLGRLLDSVADRLPIYTPGPPFKLSAVSGAFVRRLQLLEEVNMMMPAMQRSEAVAGYFRALAEDLPAEESPAGWWDVEADVGLLVGLYRHGLHAYEEVRRDPELVAAFQGYHHSRHRQSAAADKPDDPDQPGAADDNHAWPLDEVLSQRVRQLFTLLAQAVVLAESQGLLIPLPGEGLALSERLLQLPPSAGYVEAGETFFTDDLWEDDHDTPLEELLAADETSDGSDADAAYYATTYRGRGRGRGRWGGRRGRGRGRTPQAVRLAAEAAAFGAPVVVNAGGAGVDEEDGEECGGGWGRRRVRAPNSRYADHVLLPVAPYEGGHHHHHTHHHAAEAKGGSDSSKKQRKELLTLLFTWGPPATKTTQQQPPADAPDAPAAAAAGHDWEGWAGRADMPSSLLHVNDKELSAMLQEVLSEMEGLIAAARSTKPRAHPPTCECVVCVQRRRVEERKRQEAAAAGGEDGGGGSDAAAAAAGGGGGSEDESEQQQEEEAGGTEGQESRLPVKGEVLTATTAPRLQERLDMLATFRAATSTLPPGWRNSAKSSAASRELPPWWATGHDGALVEGVVKHGYGNWAAICEDESLPFKSAASHYGYNVDSTPTAAKAAAGKPGGLPQPDWMPDPKALTKRVKSLVTVLKKRLARGTTAGPAAAGGRGPPPPGSVAAAGGGGGGRRVVPAAGAGGLAQMRLPPPNVAAAAQIAQLSLRLGTGPALVQALQAAAAQGRPQLLAEYLRQQQQQLQANQLLLQQKQQQQQGAGAAAAAGQSVLGKRGPAAAGLPEGGVLGGARPAPAATTAGIGGGGAGGVSGVAGGLLSPEAIASFLRTLPAVRRDASGAAVMPLAVSKDLLIISLGRVQPVHPAFHTAAHIFPVGYIATCTFPSSVVVGSTTRYTTTIAEGQGGAALFVVVTADAPGKQWVATTAARVWQQVRAQVQAAQPGVVPPADGVTQMGLTHPLVSALIQELPDASACKDFRPEHSPAPAHVVRAIQQHQAAVRAAQQQTAAARAAGTAPAPAAAAAAAAAAVGGGGRGASGAVLPNAGMTPAAARQQQMLAVQLQQQQQVRRLSQTGPPLQQQAAAAVAAPPQDQQQILQQMLQQRQAVQQQLHLRQGLAAAPGGDSTAAAGALQQQRLLQQQMVVRLLQQQQQQQGPPQ